MLEEAQKEEMSLTPRRGSFRGELKDDRICQKDKGRHVVLAEELRK